MIIPPEFVHLCNVFNPPKANWADTMGVLISNTELPIGVIRSTVTEVKIANKNPQKMMVLELQ
jgi:hypothetical protein